MTAPSLHDFIRELDETKTHYSLTSVREGAVLVEVAIPGERWEIEFFDYRETEIEIYRSDGEIYGPEKLEELRRYWRSNFRFPPKPAASVRPIAGISMPRHSLSA